ncbi:hypothetical protein [Micromonospora gifhornensis]|uniref:hypothetical protein n=1 Tax=Micromonospora gifhornensis TaxID=84594 RepID=UPI003659752A
MVVPTSYSGPPGSGNGGWACGLIAQTLAMPDGVPEITLHRPVPVGVRLAVHREMTGFAVHDPAERRVASVGACRAPIPPVELPGQAWSDGVAPRHGAHHLPSCHVCGPARSDGLRSDIRLLPDGRTSSRVVMPAIRTPATLWAALDCPGGWTVTRPGRPWLLGRLAVAVDEVPSPGAECVVAGHAVQVAGRKALVRTTLYAPDRRVLARAQATWIAPRPGRRDPVPASEEET